MAAPYSTQFFAGAWAIEHTYAVPAGYIAVVRELDVVNGETTAQTIRAGTSAGADFWIQAIEPVKSVQWTGRLVMNPGEELRVYSQGVTGWSVIASGYLLTQ